MSRCYIPEISIRTIRKPDNINKLKNSLEYDVVSKKIICSIDGFYEIKDNEIIKFINIDNKGAIFENFVDKYTLIACNSYEKKVGSVEFIPFESQELDIHIESFAIPESNNKFILEYKNNRVSDFYFKTKEKITQNNIFLNNDVSLILKTLNV